MADKNVVRVRQQDIVDALVANRIHAKHCPRFRPINDEKARPYKRSLMGVDCTCWVDADELIVLDTYDPRMG